MAASAFLQGILLYLGIICSLGAQNLFLVHQGCLRNRAKQFAAASAGADIMLMSAGTMGLSAALNSTPDAHRAMAAFGALFLFAYGLALIRSSLRTGASSSFDSGGGVAGLPTWAGITLLNPAYYIDNLVVIGGTAAQSHAAVSGYFLAGASLGALVWFFGLVLLAERASSTLLSRPARRAMSAAGGVVMIWTAATLAKASLV